jgi:hypothetical protein
MSAVSLQGEVQYHLLLGCQSSSSGIAHQVSEGEDSLRYLSLPSLVLVLGLLDQVKH